MRGLRWFLFGSAACGLLAMLEGKPAHAAPFCVQTESVPAECLYFDSAACAARAKQINGYCTVNAAELRLAPDIGHYCLITSGPVSSCLYADSSSCDAEAKRQHGVCVSAPARSESPPPDAYRATRPLTVGGGVRN